MPTRRRESFGSVAGQAVRLVDSRLTPSLPVLPSTEPVGSAIASSSQHVADKTTLYAIDCLGGPQWWHVAHHASKGASPSPHPGSVGSATTSLPPTSTAAHPRLPWTPAVQLVAGPGVAGAATSASKESGSSPAGSAAGSAYFSDLGTPGSPTEGTDSLLALRAPTRARPRPGRRPRCSHEAWRKTVSVHCARRCTVRRIGQGPVATHGEGPHHLRTNVTTAIPMIVIRRCALWRGG